MGSRNPKSTLKVPFLGNIRSKLSRRAFGTGLQILRVDLGGAPLVPEGERSLVRSSHQNAGLMVGYSKVSL